MILIKDINLYGENVVDVLISNGKIIKIDKDIKIDGISYEISDAKEKIAIPGYIDQHVHITGGGGEGGFINKVPELKLIDCIEAGVCTIVGLLGTDGTTRNVENLLSKTKALNAYGIDAYCLTGSYEYPSPTITGSVKRDITFIDEIIGVKIAISDHRSSHITKEELIRLASEARLGGLISGKPGVVHLHVGKGKDKLSMLIDIVKTTDIPISVFRPTHIGKVLEDAVEFANLGGYIDFTSGTDVKKTASEIDRASKLTKIDRITLSTDSNGSMPIWNDKSEMIGIGVGKMTTMHETVKSLVSDFNYSWKEATIYSTENVAKALNMYPRKGVIDLGSSGDIILLDSDKNIDSVILGGKLMMDEKEILVKGNFE